MRIQIAELPAYARQVLAELCGAGHTAYYAGGCVRDCLLGVPPGDVDIATSATPAQVESLFARTLPTGRAHGTVTVLSGGGAVEVTTFRAETGYADARHPDGVRFGVCAGEDALRRDFTVNALFADAQGEVIDHTGGLEDMRRGILRAVGDARTRFSEDALRMLRAVRLSAATGFAIEAQTRAALLELAPLCSCLAAERVRQEVEKTLSSPRPQAVGEMLQAGLLTCLCGARGMDVRTLRALSAARTEDRLALLLAGLSLAGWGSAEQLCRALKTERALLRLVESVLRAHAVAGEGAVCARRMLMEGGERGARAAALLTDRPQAVLGEICGALARGECCSPRGLALSGREIAALCPCPGDRGALIRRLVCHVVEHPQDNERARLLELL